MKFEIRPYKYIGCKCYTHCYYRPEFIGSIGCLCCDYFIEDNKEEQVIICKYQYEMLKKRRDK